jgi:WD40 repeat protein
MLQREATMQNRRSFYLILTLILASQLIVSCSSPPATARIDERAQAVPATETNTPVPTATNTPIPQPTHTFTPEPTPTPGIDSLVPDAGAMCEAALSAPLSGGVPTWPAIFLRLVAYEDEGWELYHFPHQAQSIEEVQSMICIRQIRVQVDKYTDGAAAYQVDWIATLVNWTDGTAYARTSVTGYQPPIVKSGSGDGYGWPPRDKLLAWWLSYFDDLYILVADDPSDIAFSPDGKTIALAGQTTVEIWDVSSKQRTHTLEGHAGVVNGIDFSPDGRHVLSTSYDATVKLWDASTGQELRTLVGHTEEVNDVVFSPDGKSAVSVSDDDRAILWDLEAGQPLRFYEHGSSIKSVAISADGETLATGGLDKRILIWDVASGDQTQVLEGHEDSIRSLAFSPTAEIVASGTGDNSARLWSTETGQALHVLDHPQNVTAVAFSPDGAYMATGCYDDRVRIWRADSGEWLQTLVGHTSKISSLAFAPDGGSLVSVSEGDDTVRFWDLSSIE